MSNISLGGFKKKFSSFKFPASVPHFFSKLKKRPVIIIGLLLLIILVLFSLQQIYSNKPIQSISSTGKHSPSATPCIPRILPGGKQIYQNTRGKDVVGPKLFNITIDPFDPQKGQKINVTADIKNDSPVTKAIVILTTDNKTVEENMKLISGETTDGTWTTEIKLEDTYLCIYKLGFNLQSETGNYEGTMVYRQ